MSLRHKFDENMKDDSKVGLLITDLRKQRWAFVCFALLYLLFLAYAYFTVFVKCGCRDWKTWLSVLCRYQCKVHVHCYNQ